MKTWKDVCVKQDRSILDVMRIIDSQSSKFAAVVDENWTLLGTVTDGDIRRGLLRGISLESKVREILNPNPTTLSSEISKKEILRIMKEKDIAQIPLTDANKKMVGIVSLQDLLSEKKYMNPVFILAGGLGSRLGPLTTDCPKPMLKVGNKPILETILLNLKEQGFEEFFLSVNYKSEMIEQYFGDGQKWGLRIQYVREDKKLGTAGPLGLHDFAKDGPILVMNGDILTKINFASLMDEHLKSGRSATMCVRQFDFQVPFGVVQTNEDQITAIEEKPVFSWWVSGGVYVLNPEVLKFIPKNSYFEMPALFDQLIREKLPTGVFPIHEYWLDVGRMDDFEKAHGDFFKVFK